MYIVDTFLSLSFSFSFLSFLSPLFLSFFTLNKLLWRLTVRGRIILSSWCWVEYGLLLLAYRRILCYGIMIFSKFFFFLLLRSICVGQQRKHKILKEGAKIDHLIIFTDFPCRPSIHLSECMRKYYLVCVFQKSRCIRIWMIFSNKSCQKINTKIVVDIVSAHKYFNTCSKLSSASHILQTAYFMYKHDSMCKSILIQY